MPSEERHPAGWPGAERIVDDWLSEPGQFDWVDDPRSYETTSDLRSGSIRPDRSRLASYFADAGTIARRRRPVLVGLGVVVVLVVAVVIASSGGGSSPNGPESQGAAPDATSAAQAGASSATPTQPTSSSLLRLTLPAGGTLRVGDSGAAVVKLQKLLAALSFRVGRPDGSFGPTTRTAVVAFQKRYGLSPDGIVGAATAQKLNHAVETRG